MTTNALEYHLEGFYKMYNSPHSRPQRFNIISAEEYKALKMLVLAETTALFDFLLTKVGLDPGVLAELSVTPARAASVNERFTELISDSWPRIRERIRFCLASINGILPSDVTGNSIESWYATRVNRAWPTKIPCLLLQARFEEGTVLMFPNLQAILQQAARMAGGISKTGCKGSYGSYGTPTDETIIRAAWGSPGGQIDRLT